MRFLPDVFCKVDVPAGQLRLAEKGNTFAFIFWRQLLRRFPREDLHGQIGGQFSHLLAVQDQPSDGFLLPDGEIPEPEEGYGRIRGGPADHLFGIHRLPLGVLEGLVQADDDEVIGVVGPFDDLLPMLEGVDLLNGGTGQGRYATASISTRNPATGKEATCTVVRAGRCSPKTLA